MSTLFKFKLVFLIRSHFKTITRFDNNEKQMLKYKKKNNDNLEMTFNKLGMDFLLSLTNFLLTQAFINYFFRFSNKTENNLYVQMRNLVKMYT